MAIPFSASISSNPDSCISVLIGRLLWGVPDLSDGAHVARFSWLVYILSNMSLGGTENCIPSRKCQTVVAGLCWHCTVMLFWRILAEVDTCLAVDRKHSDLHLQSVCSNKQHLMWFTKIKSSKEENSCSFRNEAKNIRARKSMYIRRNDKARQRE